MFDQQPAREDDLLKYLADEFAATPQGDKLGKLASRGVFQFVEFAREFLNNNRPTTVFPENDNYGVTLSNNRRVIIAPQANLRGMMSSDDSIQITAQPGKTLRAYGTTHRKTPCLIKLIWIESLLTLNLKSRLIETYNGSITSCGRTPLRAS